MDIHASNMYWLLHPTQKQVLLISQHKVFLEKFIAAQLTEKLFDFAYLSVLFHEKTAFRPYTELVEHSPHPHISFL
jgi:hypothetical protein